MRIRIWDADPDLGSGIFWPWIRDPGWKNSGPGFGVQDSGFGVRDSESGINIPIRNTVKNIVNVYANQFCEESVPKKIHPSHKILLSFVFCWYLYTGPTDLFKNIL